MRSRNIKDTPLTVSTSGRASFPQTSSNGSHGSSRHLGDELELTFLKSSGFNYLPVKIWYDTAIYICMCVCVCVCVSLNGT